MPNRTSTGWPTAGPAGDAGPFWSRFSPGGPRSFGTGSTAYVRLDGGFIADRHLGSVHIRRCGAARVRAHQDRDVRQTYLALAVLPGLPRRRGGSLSRGAPDATPLHRPARVASADLVLSLENAAPDVGHPTLVARVILSQRAVFRTREVAGLTPPPDGSMTPAGSGPCSGGSTRSRTPTTLRQDRCDAPCGWLAAIWSNHPAMARRLDALDGRAGQDLLRPAGDGGRRRSRSEPDRRHLQPGLQGAGGLRESDCISTGDAVVRGVVAVLPSVVAVAGIAGIACGADDSRRPAGHRCSASRSPWASATWSVNRCRWLYADGNVWGIFRLSRRRWTVRFSGLGRLPDSLCRRVLTWSYENSVVWNQPPQRSLRRSSVVRPWSARSASYPVHGVARRQRPRRHSHGRAVHLRPGAGVQPPLLAGAGPRMAAGPVPATRRPGCVAGRSGRSGRPASGHGPRVWSGPPADPTR